MDLEELLRNLENSCSLPGTLLPKDATLRLVDDFGLDSLDILELVVRVEEIAPIQRIDVISSFPLIETLADVFRYYEQVCSWATTTTSEQEDPFEESLDPG